MRVICARSRLHHPIFVEQIFVQLVPRSRPACLQPRLANRAGGLPPWEESDCGATWAQLDDAALSLGAVTRPPSSFVACGMGPAATPQARGCGGAAGQPGGAAQWHGQPGSAGLDGWLSSTAALLSGWQVGEGAAPPSLAASPGALSLGASARELPHALPMAPGSNASACSSPSPSRRSEQPPEVAASSAAAPFLHDQSPAPPSVASSSCPDAGSYARLAASSQREQQASPPPAQQQQQQQKQQYGSTAGAPSSEPAQPAPPPPPPVQPPQQQAQQQHLRSLPLPALQQLPLNVDPSDFNAMLAALQRERSVAAGLQLELQVLITGVWLLG